MSGPPRQHLPPVERSSNLKLCRDGKVRAIEKIDIPLDEYGVPVPVELIHEVAAMVDSEYVWPKYTNVHHLSWPRRSYHEHESDTAALYRESSSLMMNIPIQFHNFIHAVTLPPPMPSVEVMSQRVLEQRSVDILFELGRRTIRYARWQEDAERLMENARPTDSKDLEDIVRLYRSLSANSERFFYGHLEQTPEEGIGLMPDKYELASSGILRATQKLGRLAAVESLDFRRESQLAVVRHGNR